MDFPTPTMSNLFAQLGLPADGLSINRFIEQHGPLPENVLLADAPFWTRPGARQAALCRSSAPLRPLG